MDDYKTAVWFRSEDIDARSNVTDQEIQLSMLCDQKRTTWQPFSDCNRTLILVAASFHDHDDGVVVPNSQEEQTSRKQVSRALPCNCQELAR